MNHQEVFDRALKGVRAQGGFARKGNTGSPCLYYHEETGRRCGIGQALTRAQAMDLQDEIDACDQASGVTTLFVFPLVVLAGLPNDMSFLRRVQEAHDEATSMDRFEAKMAQVAQMYNLTYTAPEV